MGCVAIDLVEMFGGQSVGKAVQSVWKGYGVDGIVIILMATDVVGLEIGCDQRDSVSDCSFDVMVRKFGAVWIGYW